MWENIRFVISDKEDVSIKTIDIQIYSSIK